VDKIPSGIPDIPPAPRDLELWDETNKPVEAFTLMHHDLNIFTNSLQVSISSSSSMLYLVPLTMLMVKVSRVLACLTVQHDHGYCQ